MFWKLITSIPHFFVIGVLSLTLVVVVPIAWFAILINARFPSSLHDYVSNVLGWWARVQGYVLSLTDDFPPFSLMADAPAGGRTAYLASSTVGVLAVSAFVGFFSLVAILSPGNVTVEVTYERLLSGEVRPGETLVQLESREDTFESVKTTGTFELTGAADPADALLPLLVVEPGHRFVQFELVMQNQTYLELESDQSSFGLEDAAGDTHRPILAIIGGRVHHDQHSAPWDLVDTSWEVEQGESATALIVFELPTGIDPVEFRFNIGHHVPGASSMSFDSTKTVFEQAKDDDLFGLSVTLAARIGDWGEPGQVLVSDVVRQLLLGKGFEFTSVGEAELKGLDEPVSLYEVAER